VIAASIFSARQHIAYMLSAPYASARLSVCPSVTRVDQSKTVERRITHANFHHTVPSSFFRAKFHAEILRGYPGRGVKQGRGG